MPPIVQAVNIFSGIGLVVMGLFCIFFAKENKEKSAALILNAKEKIDSLFDAVEK
jgi:hypothetical protein